MGYEGSDLASFLRALATLGISRVIDVRELPLSRKRGFSKLALASALADNDVDYIHLRDLGDPKPGREAARRGDHAGFMQIYRRHLSESPAQAALAQASRHALARRSCLLCFERNHQGCHRTIVADAMALSTGLEVVHLNLAASEQRNGKAGNERATPHLW